MEFHNMDQKKISKIPSELSLTAILSGGLTLMLTVTYTALCILALVYRFQCDTGLASGATGSSYFMDTVYRVYIQTDSCDNPVSSPPSGVDLMNADTVFMFVLVILVLSVFSCAVAIVLIVGQILYGCQIPPSPRGGSGYVGLFLLTKTPGVFLHSSMGDSVSCYTNYQNHVDVALESTTLYLVSEGTSEHFRGPSSSGHYSAGDRSPDLSPAGGIRLRYWNRRQPGLLRRIGSEFMSFSRYRSAASYSDMIVLLKWLTAFQASSLALMAVTTTARDRSCPISADFAARVVVDEKKSRYIFATVWVHVCIYFSAAVVDLVLAIFFGLDNAKLSDAMNNWLPGIVVNYRHDVLRMGTQLLMAVALKGYLAHLINAVLLILLAVYATRFRNRLQTEELQHSIHKRGAINAYELQKREDVWQNQQESDLTFTRGQHLNAGYDHDEPRRPRSPARAAPLSPLSDYSNRDYDRSDSWHHSQGSSRPFSYMEEPRRAARAAPAPAEPWRREPWAPAPPVPAPDYSPPSRRLKSALKPNYV